MRLSLAARLICLLAAVLPLQPARALQFEQVAFSDTETVLVGTGPVIKGDKARLERAMAAVPAGHHLLLLALDSPGGSVAEGDEMAQVIRRRGLPIIIPPDRMCASICFLMFAASVRRLAAASARVGVHSASVNGEENDQAMVVTMLLARAAGDYGIPPAIIGKMVQTTPDNIAWLDRADLMSMNVAVYDGDVRTALRETFPDPVGRGTQPAPVSPPVPVPVVLPVRPPAPMPGIAAGRDDRRVWDAWFGALRGLYHDGAAFAVGQMGRPSPVSCYGPNHASLGEFTPGCLAAQQRLAPVEARLRGNADYAAGWNSAAQPVAVNEPVEAEYRGAYFCGRQVARVTLKVFPPVAGDGRRRAMFGFGPEPTSPDVPTGAFVVEGMIELAGGVIALTPVRWVSQPAGYQWFGLSGSSEDGGRTFSGRVLESAVCNIFTLKRVTNVAATR